MTYRTISVSRLQNFCIQEKSEDSFYLWFTRSQGFIERMKKAFPQVSFETVRPIEAKGYSHCLFVSDTSVEIKEAIRQCLTVFQRTLFLETDLDNCFALGWHSRPGKPGKPELTTLGQWIHLAKSYSTEPDSAGSLPVAGLIAEQMAEFIKRHPTYRSSAGVISVLPSNPEKAFDLPAYLAGWIEEDTGIPFLRSAIYKTRVTAQMKYCQSLEDKLDNIRESVGVNEEMIRGKHLIIVDDIYESGMTLGETARVLREQGAQGVHGLIATKTLRGRFK